MIQMLHARLCHRRDADRVTNDDKQTYVVNARVTPPKGVTSSQRCVPNTQMDALRPAPVTLAPTSIPHAAFGILTSTFPFVPASLRRSVP
jgi:hypothetical protein